MVSPKEELRYSNERSQSHGYYDDRSIHYYRDDRDVVQNANNGSNNMARHSQESSESDRGK